MAPRHAWHRRRMNGRMRAAEMNQSAADSADWHGCGSFVFLCGCCEPPPFHSWDLGPLNSLERDTTAVRLPARPKRMLLALGLFERAACAACARRPRSIRRLASAPVPRPLREECAVSAASVTSPPPLPSSAPPDGAALHSEHIG